MNNDYASRQAERDRNYLNSYDTPEAIKWIKSLPPEERHRLEAEGLLKPMLDRCGSTMREEDAGESNLASATTDIFGAIDDDLSPPPAITAENTEEKMQDMVRRLIAEVLVQNNARLSLECLALACGLTMLQGESMTSIAKRHGVTRAAVSKRCVDITQKLNLPPSRSMRSIKAREEYRKVQIKLHKRNERTDHR